MPYLNSIDVCLTSIFTIYAIIRCDNVNVKCNKNMIVYWEGNQEYSLTAFNFGKICMEQIKNLVPFQRDDSLKELFLQHRKAWTRDFLNGWMKKSLLKWSHVKNLETLNWLERDYNTDPYSTDTDLLAHWELATRSETRKAQRPTKNHIPVDIYPLVAREEIQKFVFEVKAQPSPRSIMRKHIIEEQRRSESPPKVEVSSKPPVSLLKALVFFCNANIFLFFTTFPFLYL